MALVIPPGFGQAAFEMKNEGDPQAWFMTLGVDLAADTTPWTDSLDTLVAAWAQTVALGFATTTTFVGAHLAVGQDGGPPLRLFGPSGVSGSSASAKLPQNCAVLVTKTTSRAGRTGKGRLYIPNWLDEGQCDNVGNIDSTERDGLQGVIDDFFDLLITPVGSSSTPPVLLHNAGAPGGTLPTTITGMQVDPVIATQRRRLRR